MFKVNHKILKLFLAVLLVPLLCLWPARAQEEVTAASLLACIQNLNSASFRGDLRIQTFRPEFSAEFFLEVWSSPDNEQVMIRVIEPEDEAGSGYLLLGEDELWFFTPLIGQAIPLPSVALGEALFGSDVAVEDLYRGTIGDRYEPELLGTRTDDEGSVIHRLRLLPKPDADVVYGKLEVDVSDGNCAVLRVDYYDQRDTLVREALFDDFVEEGGLVFARHSIINDLLRENSFTEELVESFEVGVDIPAERFTLECLEDESQCG